MTEEAYKAWLEQFESIANMPLDRVAKAVTIRDIYLMLRAKFIEEGIGEDTLE